MQKHMKFSNANRLIVCVGVGLVACAAIASFLVIAEYRSEPVSSVSDMSDDWSLYHSDAGHYAVQYPLELVPVENGGRVEFNGADPGPWGIVVSTEATTFKDTAEFLTSDPTIRPLVSLRGESGMVVVSLQSAVDQDQGKPVYATVLEAVYVEGGTLYRIVWNNQTPAGTVPSIDATMARFVGSFAVDPVEPTPEEAAWHDANAALAQFLGLLHEGTYAAAAGRYDGDLSQLREWNPTVDPNDAETLWRNACETNGLLCLKPETITPVRLDEDGTFHFAVEYEAETGGVFSQNGVIKFSFVVSRGEDGIYVVQTLPPYQP